MSKCFATLKYGPLRHTSVMVDNLPMQPTPDAYEKAFAAIEDQITEKQLLMLAFHHAQPGRAVSATKLAEFIGYKNYNAVNMQYGRLGSMICQQLGLELPGVQVGSLVDFVYPDQAANDHFL